MQPSGFNVEVVQSYLMCMIDLPEMVVYRVASLCDMLARKSLCLTFSNGVRLSHHSSNFRVSQCDFALTPAHPLAVLPRWIQPVILIRAIRRLLPLFMNVQKLPRILLRVLERVLHRQHVSAPLW